jgi:hypothetical protein
MGTRGLTLPEQASCPVRVIASGRAGAACGVRPRCVPLVWIVANRYDRRRTTALACRLTRVAAAATIRFLTNWPESSKRYPFFQGSVPSLCHGRIDVPDAISHNH